MVYGTKWWGAAPGPRWRHRWVLAGVIAGTVTACSVGGWFVVAGWGGDAAAAQMQSAGIGRGRPPQPQLSEGEVRAGLDARLARLSARQVSGEAAGIAAAAAPVAAPRWATREQSPPPRIPPTPPLDLLEEASRAMEGQP